MRWLALIALALPLALAACAHEQANQVTPRGVVPGISRDTSLAPGQWGGQHIELVVAPAGSASLTVDCAAGYIPGQLILGPGGFSSPGTWIREHGGPVHIDEIPEVHPAQYSGTITGDTMTLHIRLTDTGEDIGTYTLHAGEPGTVLRCL